ncbi:MAG: hypothetical protein K6A74_08740 [Lachnospiraceae bacterium]|nr:hypothetical protein [Lachnospiraceae bacterium]
MDTGTFTESLLKLSKDKREDLSTYYAGMFSVNSLKEPIRRKNAARAVHVFMTIVLNSRDEDWGRYSELKDIYDCRICANAIAQVCIKGIMAPVSKSEFGSDLVLTEEEAGKILGRLDEYWQYLS